jgi:hypothetical protein
MIFIMFSRAIIICLTRSRDLFHVPNYRNFFKNN